MRKKFLYTLFLTAIVTSCSDYLEVTTNGDDSTDGLENIIVERAPLSVNLEEEYPYGLGEDEELPYFQDNFSEGDILFISQKGRSADPVLYYNDAASTTAGKGVQYGPETIKDNLYVYKFQPDTDADWDQGYNFVPYINAKGKSSPLNWGYIRELGSAGNSFGLYAFFVGNNDPNFHVMTWQNFSDYPTAEALARRMDMMAGYFATSSLYTRIRFRMFHLVNMLHVTLLVPVVEGNPETIEPGYSGFNEHAFDYNNECGGASACDFPGVFVGVPAWVTREFGKATAGVNENIVVNWRAPISSGEAPSVSVPTSGYSRNNSPTSMYKLKRTPSEPFELKNVKDFYPKSDRETDMVRRYEFICYFPGQELNTQNPILSIRLLTPNYVPQNPPLKDSGTNGRLTVANGVYAARFFYGSNKGQNQWAPNSPPLGIGAGTMGVYQHLTLYIPRKSNETVLVSAKVVPWQNTHTDMTLVEREEE